MWWVHSIRRSPGSGWNAGAAGIGRTDRQISQTRLNWQLRPEGIDPEGMDEEEKEEDEGCVLG